MKDTVVTIALAIIASGFLNIIANRIFTVIDKKKGKDDGIATALKLVLKKVIQDLCMDYIERGWIYDDELEDLIKIHSCYHNDLNGNGYLDIPMAHVKDLEIRRRKTEE